MLRLLSPLTPVTLVSHTNLNSSDLSPPPRIARSIVTWKMKPSYSHSCTLNKDKRRLTSSHSRNYSYTVVGEMKFHVNQHPLVLHSVVFASHRNITRGITEFGPIHKASVGARARTGRAGKTLGINI